MNLHICTISFRNDFLEDIYNSIPKGDDIIWHIARSVNNPVTLPILENDSRVKIHLLTCEDIDSSFKMNYLFRQIISTDSNSYFCLLDDDTTFCPIVYDLYNDYKERDKKYMIIGKQVDKNNQLRLPATLPHECAIDSGNVLCHSHVLVPEGWPDKHWDNIFHADYDFWNRCYKHFGLTGTDLVQEIISIYNYFSDKPDTLDYVR